MAVSSPISINLSFVMRSTNAPTLWLVASTSQAMRSPEEPPKAAACLMHKSAETRIPNMVGCGHGQSCVPFWSRNLGRSFRMRRRSKQKAPTRDGAGAKGAAYAVDAEHGQPVSNGHPRSTLPAVTGAAVWRIHHGQIGTQLTVKRAVGVLHGGRRGDRCDLADALAAICHRQ